MKSSQKNRTLTLKKTYNVIALMAIISVALSSCSNVGLLSERNRWIVDDISGIGDFFKVYFVLQLSIILIGLLLGTVLGKLGYIISLGVHFIWIVAYRDYGFLNVLLLFTFFSIVSFLFNLIISRKRD